MCLRLKYFLCISQIPLVGNSTSDAHESAAGPSASRNVLFIALLKSIPYVLKPSPTENINIKYNNASTVKYNELTIRSDAENTLFVVARVFENILRTTCHL